MARSWGAWLGAVLMIAALVGCGAQKPAPAVDETDPGVAAGGLEEDSKRTGVK